MTERDLPHMPIDHNVLMGEIRAVLREDATLMKSEVKRAIMRARNLPLNMNDSYWDIRGPSRRGITSHRTMFNGRFDLAWSKIIGRRR